MFSFSMTLPDLFTRSQVLCIRPDAQARRALQGLDLLGWPILTLSPHSHHVCQDVICFGEAWSLLEDPVMLQWLKQLGFNCHLLLL